MCLTCELDVIGKTIILVPRNGLTSSNFKLARHIIYRFIWGDRRDISWRRMILDKNEGGLRLRNPCLLFNVCMIRRIWSQETSLWINWVRDRYIKGKALEEIDSCQRDFPIWSDVLRGKELNRRFIVCRANYHLKSVMVDARPMMKCIYDRLKPRVDLDPYAKGIWSSLSTKMSICFWRLRWSKLICFNKLQQWGVSFLIFYILCNREEETTSHLLLNYPYSK